LAADSQTVPRSIWNRLAFPRSSSNRGRSTSAIAFSIVKQITAQGGQTEPSNVLPRVSEAATASATNVLPAPGSPEIMVSIRKGMYGSQSHSTARAFTSARQTRSGRDTNCSSDAAAESWCFTPWPWSFPATTRSAFSLGCHRLVLFITPNSSRAEFSRNQSETSPFGPNPDNLINFADLAYEQTDWRTCCAALYVAEEKECLMVGELQTGYIVVPHDADFLTELNARCAVVGRDSANWVHRFRWHSLIVGQ